MASSLQKHAEKTQSESAVIFKKAIALSQQGRAQEAMQAYREMLLVDINHAPSWANLGTTLRQFGLFEASAACTKRALEISPGKSAYLTNYGNCLADLDRMEEALAAHAEAAEDKPDDCLIRYNYAIGLREAGEFREALKHFDFVCKKQPDNVNAHWDRAVTYLHLGDYRRGWEAFEIRWKIGQIQERATDIPQWRGENLKGKTIVVHAEQGFGDTILCSRYIPLVKKHGGRVILECNKALHRLFRTIQGLDKMVEPGKLDEVYHYHVPMMSLPGIFETTLSNIPPVPALDIPKAPPAAAQRLLDLGADKFKVGIVWSGSVTFKNNRKRAVAMSRFLPFSEVPGVQLYSLQKGPCEKDLAAAGATGLVLELGPHVNDFADTAAVLQQLDLVIMTDSSVAHLAASVGCPVWNLLCHRPYWLYLSDREDSPWYPFMRFIRQQKPGVWDDVFAQAVEDLNTAVTMKEAGKWPSTTLKKPRKKVS